MQRFRPALGVLAVAMLVSSVAVAAVEATGDFVPAALRDRQGLARPVPQDAPSAPQDEPSDVPDCPRRVPYTNGTCVTIRNQTRDTTLLLESITAEEPSIVYQQPPQEIGPAQSGMWVTGNRTAGEPRPDMGHVRYRLRDGPISAIDYRTIGIFTGTLSVTVLGGSTRPIPYCRVETKGQTGRWLSRLITYSDTGIGQRGFCVALLEDETSGPTPTPSASPGTPAPAGALTPAPVPADSAAPPGPPGVGGSPTVGPRP
jgi:hypothetical protein